MFEEELGAAIEMYDHDKGDLKRLMKTSERPAATAVPARRR